MDILREAGIPIINTVIIAFLGGIAGWATAYLKLFKHLKDGVLAILHDRLYQACSHYLSPEINCISPSEMRNLDKMYKAYAKLGGNGQIKEMYERCMELTLCFKEGEQ